MTETPNLKLPLLAASQAQKHVTHNEALAILDVTAQARVIEIGLTTPPVSPSDGDAYIPGSGATGAWTDWDLNIAHLLDGSWRKIVPEEGWLVYNLDDGLHYVFRSGDWSPLLVAGGVAFTPAGGIAAETVQAAIEELDAEKLAKAGGTMTGDLTLAGDPDAALKAATKQYVDAIVAAQDAMVFKGVIDCSANPNYPAADRGHTYRVSVAGKIGGGSGPNVEAGDLLLCLTDSTASGNHATVGAAWSIAQVNLDGAVIGPASAASGNVATFNGTTGKLIQDGGKALPAGTIVGTSDAQTLTNKTLTAPAISSPTGITAADIASSATGDVAATNVQAAIAELASEKVAKIASTDNRVPRFDGTGGVLQASGVAIDDSDNVTANCYASKVAVLADDTATSFNVPGGNPSSLILIQSNAQAGPNGLFAVRASAAPFCKMLPIDAGGHAVDVGTGALTGTTGTDGRHRVNTHTDGKVYIENRSGGAVTYVLGFHCPN